MKFKFSLQPVLQHRQALEEKAQQAFGEAKHRLDEAQRHRDSIREGIRERGEQVRHAQRAGLSFAHRELFENWIERQRQEVLRLEQVIQDHLRQVEQRRAEMIESMRARKVMDQLREQERRQWLQEQAKNEMKFFDDVANRNFMVAQASEKDAHTGERIAR